MRLGIERLIIGAYLLVCLSTHAHAGGAYVVDDAAIGKPGECQVESWLSSANNGDFIGMTQPACVARLGIPVEFTLTNAAVRSDAWVHFVGLQAKIVPVPLEASRVALSLSVATTLDVTTGASTFTHVNAPITIKVHDQVRINVNAGVLWDRDTHFFWGASFEWDFKKSWTLIAEVFGFTGEQDEPRLQAGLRFTPTKSVDVDVIYGHNIAGENANWITAGLTVRF
jgi:hypothetical protein